MNQPKDDEWLKDYEEFVNSEGSAIPEHVKLRVFNKIQKLINPSPLLVFLKILGIHLAVGFLSLSVCHQFGMNPFNTEKSLADLMMSVGGHHFCMFGCGVLFVSLSLFAAGYFLTIEEVNALKRTEFLQTLVLGIISLGLFAAFGAEIAVGISAVWLVGGLIGGFAATEAVWRLKQV
ncbi:MAG: hypothetical protein WA160_01885 [Pseudobdellovibrio sp.]